MSVWNFYLVISFDSPASSFVCSSTAIFRTKEGNMKRGNSSPLGYFSAIIGHLSEGCEGRKRCKLVRLGTTGSHVKGCVLLYEYTYYSSLM